MILYYFIVQQHLPLNVCQEKFRPLDKCSCQPLP